MAVLTQDPFAGHRHPVTGNPVGDPDRFTEWDYALGYALQTIEDFTMPSGVLVWEHDDDHVVVEAKSKIDKFEQSKDAITGAKNYKPTAGARFFPEVISRRSDGYIQTFSEWIEKESKKSKSEVDDGAGVDDW